MQYQRGILAPVPPVARYLTFHLRHRAEPHAALGRLATLCDGDAVVVGIGQSLVAACGTRVEGLRGFPSVSGPGFDVPATPAPLWCWLRGTDRGELVHATHRIVTAIGDAFLAPAIVDAFMFRGGRDLSGYEDGTENPEGDEALAAAFVSGHGAGLDGSSFVAVQRWRHDLDALAALTTAQRDATFGRRIADNSEIDDAPESAHVKRTAQESFEPEAFVLRRSMPWADATGEGLVFVAFGASLNAFVAQQHRMSGGEDGIVDALYSFTRPETGATFWCPPASDGGLDLDVLLG
jgi:putative iron-dependent peroxidase